MKRYIAALDQGTTSSRCVIFDRQGRIVGMAQREFTQLYPQPGWVEQDPMEIWSSQYCRPHRSRGPERASSPRRSPPSASPTSGRPPFCGTRHTGRPIHNAIVWQCRRTAAHVRGAEGGHRAGGTSSKSTPACSSTPISPPPRSSGSWTTWTGARQRARDGAAALRHGGHLAAVETHRGQGPRSPTAPTPAAPCSSTSTRL